MKNIHINGKIFKIIPQSIRYSKFNEWHPCGRKTTFRMTFITPDNKKIRKLFSDIGTSQNTAFANALRQLAIYS